MQPVYVYYFLVLSSFFMFLSAYLWKSNQKAACMVTLGSGFLIAITGTVVSYYSQLNYIMFNLLSLGLASSLVGTMYSAVKKTRVLVLLTIPAALSIRLFITIDTFLYIAGLTLCVGVWNSYDYSKVNITKYSSNLREKILFGPFSSVDRILRARIQKGQLSRSLFLTYAMLSTILVLGAVLVYVLGLRLVSDISLILFVAFLFLGRLEFLRRFPNQ